MKKLMINLSIEKMKESMTEAANIVLKLFMN